MSQITSLEQLSALYGEPSKRAKNKAMDHIDDFSRTMIEHSPYIVLSTVDQNGFTDVSPRGGQPGFVKVLDRKTLLIPDSAGNNRIDSFRNLLERPQMGLMILVPGVDEVVRIKGRVSLHTDPHYSERCPDGAKPAKLVMKVAVEEAYFHCGKAIMRARLWDNHYRVDRNILPSLAQIMKAQQNMQEEVMGQEEMIAYYRESL
ncbi:pyridoxamine 5'-phosphate oxidase family protein [Photobacterium sp. GJ3]|uniref:pyridoxamine 5'-phosphate oxidase family protein n=1 Tax=Photobacterium sp. GJ3 TaxID=2829502 RepID=UPI001B8C95B8|nr:pyridoxamine 5'-phosphate oxidase family protein [Photobacterium sp. GJ3]QUJ69088.1 pyridoxamine 5'-phosphate oxidase family protein [Photobacterium sp. GJ3]